MRQTTYERDISHVFLETKTNYFLGECTELEWIVSLLIDKYS